MGNECSHCVHRAVISGKDFLSSLGDTVTGGSSNRKRRPYRGTYALAGSGKCDSDDEELYSKDLLMDCSEDDEEEQIVIINTSQSSTNSRSTADSTSQRIKQSINNAASISQQISQQAVQGALSMGKGLLEMQSRADSMTESSDEELFREHSQPAAGDTEARNIMDEIDNVLGDDGHDSSGEDTSYLVSSKEQESTGQPSQQTDIDYYYQAEKEANSAYEQAEADKYDKYDLTKQYDYAGNTGYDQQAYQEPNPSQAYDANQYQYGDQNGYPEQQYATETPEDLMAELDQAVSDDEEGEGLL